MAERRMFAKTVIDSDAFLDMPLSTQALYFHLSMRADDDGFVNSPKKIQRIVNASDDDLKLLIAKNFIIPFDTGVVVIKHWKIHNYIQNDRYKETVYLEEKAQLSVKSNRAYTLDTECIHDGYKLDAQNSIDKTSKDKNITSKDVRPSEKDNPRPKKYQTIIDSWNTLSSYGIKPIRNIADKTARDEMLGARLRQYGEESILEAIENIKSSDFLRGINKNGWTITFDWFVRPNNFPKVLEGNYENGSGNSQSNVKKDDFEDW